MLGWDLEDGVSGRKVIERGGGDCGLVTVIGVYGMGYVHSASGRILFLAHGLQAVAGRRTTVRASRSRRVALAMPRSPAAATPSRASESCGRLVDGSTFCASRIGITILCHNRAVLWAEK